MSHSTWYNLLLNKTILNLGKSFAKKISSYSKC